MTARSHVMDVYGVNVHLVTNKGAWKQLRKELDFMGKVPKSMGQTTFATRQHAGPVEGHLVLWVDVNAHDTNISLIDTCAHESTHGADRIYEWIGHSPSFGDEPMAYLVGWLTAWCYEGVAA